MGNKQRVWLLFLAFWSVVLFLTCVVSMLACRRIYPNNYLICYEEKENMTDVVYACYVHPSDDIYAYYDSKIIVGQVVIFDTKLVEK